MDAVVEIIRNEWEKASVELNTLVQRVRKKTVSNTKLIAFASGRTQPIDATICTAIVLLVRTRQEPFSIKKENQRIRENCRKNLAGNEFEQCHLSADI